MNAKASKTEGRIGKRRRRLATEVVESAIRMMFAESSSEPSGVRFSSGSIGMLVGIKMAGEGAWLVMCGSGAAMTMEEKRWWQQ